MIDEILTQNSVEAIVVGASAGGLNAMMNLFSKLSDQVSVPILVVQHISPDKQSNLAELIGGETCQKVIEAEDKCEIKKGYIYIAPPNYHMLVEDKNTIALSTEDKVNYSRPSIDLLFESAVRIYLSKLVGIILTGANSDGAKGISMIARAGGITIAQSPETAEFKVMPQAAIATGNVNFVLNIDEMAKFITELSVKRFQLQNNL